MLDAKLFQIYGCSGDIPMLEQAPGTTSLIIGGSVQGNPTWSKHSLIG